MVVGVVVVSHSDLLARGVVELAAQMAAGVPLAAAGGTDEGGIGTSLDKVLAALAEADQGDGAVLLYDLGSAEMVAQMALEMLDEEQRDRVRLSDAPLVTGALAAATTAAGGAGLEEVVAALPGGAAGEPQAAVGVDAWDVERTLTLRNPLGLHARPAALVVQALRGLDAEVEVAALGRSASARSLLGLVGLAAPGGTELRISARGPDASEALERLARLIEDGFGEGTEEVAPAPGARAAPSRAATVPEDGVLRGVPGAPGLALGPAARLHPPELEIPDRPAEDPERERMRLRAAREAIATELRAGAGGIFAAQAVLLEDPELDAAVDERLLAGQTAEQAWSAAIAEQQGRVAALPGEVFAARAADVEDAGRRVLARLLGVEAEVTVPAGSVAIADDAVPSHVPALMAADAAGLALAGGGPTSHTAILAHSLGLPLVVGLGPALLEVPEQTTVLLDGEAGTLRLAPDTETQAQARARSAQRAAAQEAERRAAQQPARLADGTRIIVAANVASVAEARAAVANGAEGVGLLRTEFLFLDREDVPTEDEQAQRLAEIAAAMEGRPLIVRTLDAGGDKPAPALGLDPVRNGFLGERGIRYSLTHPELFRAQLRAILRVAADAEVSVMFPLVTTADEVRAARAALDEARAALAAGGVRHGRPREVGIMVEVPAAALAADTLIELVDFCSVGSNDLIQYLMAADRTLPAVAHLAQPQHPALLRAIGELCRVASAAGRWVGVCGEIAGDPDLAALLVGLGVTELSMAAGSVPAAKRRLGELDLPTARRLAEEATTVGA